MTECRLKAAMSMQVCNLLREWLVLLIIPTNHFLKHSNENAPFVFREVNVLILSKKILEATTCKVMKMDCYSAKTFKIV